MAARAARLAVLAALHQDLNRPILFLTNRSDRALSLFDELSFWISSQDNYYFPEPNPLFYEDLPWSQSTRLDRLRVFTTLAHYHLPGAQQSDKAPVVIAPIRAVMTRTVPRRDFLKQSLRVRLGDRQDLHAISSQLVGIGYEYSNIVVQPGQFSRRGGILDFWLPADNLPIRLDFFGDEIDTIRQSIHHTAVEAKLEQAHIFPASEAMPSRVWSRRAAHKTSEQDIPELCDFPSNLIDYLPKNALILLDGEEFIAAAETPKKTLFNAARARMPTPASIKRFLISPGQNSRQRRQPPDHRTGHTNAEGGSELSKYFDGLASPAD